MIVVAMISRLVRLQAVNQSFERNKIMTSIFITLAAKKIILKERLNA